jgi:hypothetical protein
MTATAAPTLDVLYRPERMSRHRVELTRIAADAINFECRRYVTGRESGGWLLGRRMANGRIHVQGTTGRGLSRGRSGFWASVRRKWRLSLRAPWGAGARQREPQALRPLPRVNALCVQRQRVARSRAICGAHTSGQTLV